MKETLTNVMLVGSGGFVGAVCRYGLAGWAQRQAAFSQFPFGTLVVNLVGCFVVGTVFGLVESRQVLGPGSRVFVLMGLLGGFTTYSTFGVETFAMLRDNEFLRAFSNVAVHVILGLGLVWSGYVLGSRWAS